MRPANASTIASSMGSKPCSRKRAASAASRSAARTLRLRESRSSSSGGTIRSPFSMSRDPRPSSRETTAQLARETTCERIFASRPSWRSGKRSYSARATASSRTLSPRNSSRSYEDALSGAHEGWVNAFSARLAGSSSISRARRPGSACCAWLLVRRDVFDSLTDRLDLLGVLIRDLDPELILELHDHLDEVERVGAEILLEVRLFRDVRFLHGQALCQDFPDALVDFVAGRCHVTSLTFRWTESAPILRDRRAQWLDFASAVRLAGRAHLMRPLGPMADRALVDPRGIELVGCTALVAARFRRFSLGDCHRSGAL